MKKLAIIFVIFLCLPFLSLEATPPIMRGIKVTIESKDCNQGNFNGGHIDILVLKDEVGDRLLSTKSDFYQLHYGHIETIQYIESYYALWISYLAYVQDAYTDGTGSCRVTFMFDEEMLQFTRFKLVYFNDEGETLYMSSPVNTIEDQGSDIGIEVQDINVTLDADEPYHMDVTYDDKQGNYTFIFVIILVAYIAKYGIIIFGSIATVLVMYAIIRVVLIQINRKE